LKLSFEPHGFVLTAAVGAGKDTIDKGYEVAEVTKYFDFVNVMTYVSKLNLIVLLLSPNFVNTAKKDFHGSWEKYTGHHAPLYGRKEETGDARYLNVDWAVKYWLSKGLSRDKLVLGLPAYGRTFILEDNSKNQLGHPAKCGGNAGKVGIR